MRRRQRRDTASCVALGARERRTGRPVRVFRCLSAADAAALPRWQPVDRVSEYDSADECKAECGTSPVPSPGRRPGPMPAAARGVRGTVSEDVDEEERQALTALVDAFPWFARRNVLVSPGPVTPASQLVPIRELCDTLALNCVRPYRELLTRLLRELWLPSRPTAVLRTAHDTVVYGYAARDIAAIPRNASFVERGIPREWLPSGQAAPMVLFPGETVRVFTAALGGPYRVMAAEMGDATVFWETTADLLLRVTCRLRDVRPTSAQTVIASVVYTVPPPPPPPPGSRLPVPWMRAVRQYMSVLERLFDIPEGRLTFSATGPDGPRYDIAPGDEPSNPIVNTLRRTGIPVDAIEIEAAAGA